MPVLSTVHQLVATVASLLLFFVSVHFGTVLCEVHYIMPTDTEPCFVGADCLTLSQFAEKSANYADSNVTLFIIGGNHDLDKRISLSNKEQISILSLNDSVESSVITCSIHTAHFSLAYSSRVHIREIEFVGCDGIIRMVEQASIVYSRFINSSTSSLTILNSYVNMDSTSFISNTNGKHQNELQFFRYLQATSGTVSYNSQRSGKVGGALIVTNSTLLCDFCQFSGNTANVGGAIFSECGSNVSLRNSAFSSNHVRDCHNGLCLGGVMFVDATPDTAITVQNCSFQNNTSSQYGGVIAITEASHNIVNYNVYNYLNSRGYVSLSIQTCDFFNNRATFGGAIYSYNSNAVIFGSTFWYNEARLIGGAIVSNASSIVTLHSSRFAFNKANHGGVVGIHDHSKVHVEGCDLEHNNARSDGGTVLARLNSTAIFQGNTFTNNSANGDGSKGGVVMLLRSMVRINDSEFSNNSATSGGVLYAEMISSVSVQGSRFIGNKVDRDGTVAALFERSEMIVVEGEFIGNEAGTEGGAIKARNWSSITITNSIFSRNSAIVFGGALHIKDSSDAVVIDSQFDSNTALDGGVVNVYYFSTIKVYRSNFSNNKANITGGVISCKLDSNASIMESRFHTNIAVDIGAAVYTEDRTNVSLYGTIFTNNSATFGGAVAIRRKCTVKVNSCIGDWNTARVDGGFLYSRTNSGSVINNSLFTNNQAKNNGIVVASDSSTIVIETSMFTENRVGHDGAAAFIHDRSSAVINSCNFSNNLANNSGGTVYTRRYCNLTINSSHFHNNSAENSGGAVCIQGDSKVSIEGSTFSNNKADYGGVVRMYIQSKINVTDCQFSSNEANIGGGTVAAYKYSVVSIKNSQFILNIAGYGGVVIGYQYSAVIFDNVSCLSNRARTGGVIRTIQGSTVNVTNSNFSHNAAEIGGVLGTQRGVVSVKSSHFEHSSAALSGGAIYIDDSSTVTIHTATFWNNTAESDGGVIGVLDSSIEILEDSNFTKNRADDYGGAINAKNSSVTISNAVFEYSTSERSGGVLCAKNSSISIRTSSFTNNNASRKGGALIVHTNSSLMVSNSTFMHNAAKDSGGALYLTETSRSIINDSRFRHNLAEESGGAIFTSTKSVLNITSSIFRNNTAKMGAGVIVALNSSISFDKSLTNTKICENTATKIGGGILLTKSILYFMMNTTICHNVASDYGGGLCAYKSNIVFRSSVNFDSNQARSGGGAWLATTSLSYFKINEWMEFGVKFIKNRADNGGALFIDDNADNATCYDNNNIIGDQHSSGCFFQNVTEGLRFIFKDNFAEDSGSNLFGGLLDRCTQPSGTAHFQEISNINNLSTVSSEPVRVCLCESERHLINCSQQTHNITVKQGNPFTIQLSAVDQVHQSVSAAIQSELKEVSLPKNQAIQRIDSQCSSLDYQVFFPSVSQTYKLEIYATGPCNDIGISTLTVNIEVLRCSCGPGFMREYFSTKCLCVCDKQDDVFSTFIKECNSSTESVIRQGIFWITYLNNSASDDNSSSRYFIYPYCPLGYCHSPSKPVPINLNQPNGSDAQCAHNRRGLLCGRCKPNFSLSLGSSKCIRCPKNWHVLLAVIIVVAFFAGILLVFLILMLNLTVAVGTVNSIIFYANIIYANKRILFNHWQLQPTFASVFVSWLNLDIGFDVCFFDGMDIYVKTWLQLAFSLYILLLVIVIIWISAHSSRLANLLGRRNPVATLATLILLSYTKLLEAIINSFSFVTLNYPNGTTTTNWLPDANMEYTDWKLIFLICCAAIILAIGLSYTILIFLWQWLLRFSRSKLLTWAWNQKLHLFIDSYHIPYTTKHRYWTGLLLLVRVIIYLISAFTASINPRIPLLSIVIIICTLFLYKTVFMIRVYKNWLLNAIETLAFFNIAVFVIFTWYSFDEPSNKDKEFLQRVVTYISVGAMLFLFLLIILFHACKYGNARAYALFQSTKFVRKVRQQVLLTHAESSPSHRSLYRLFDVIDNARGDSDDANDNGYTTPFVPTKTTISLTDCDESLIDKELD